MTALNATIGAMRRDDGSDHIDPVMSPVTAGPPGARGWTPVFAGEDDGTRTLLKVEDWTGGQGAKPATGYIGPGGSMGLVSKASAYNFNRAKRIESYSATTRLTAGNVVVAGVTVPVPAGEALFEFTSPFPNPPRVNATARAVIGGRPVVAEVVVVTTTYARVRASQSKATLANLLNAVFDLLGGVVIDALVIEA